MPRKKTNAADPLAIVHARIRDAQKKLVPVHRESIGMDSASFENVALLVERGIGSKTIVLRQALATGLRVLVNGTDVAPTPTPTTADEPMFEAEAETAASSPPFGSIVNGAFTPHLQIAPAIDTPPSAQRAAMPQPEDDDEDDPQ